MKWLSDPTGRFDQRPYYEQGELDGRCERVVSDFLREFYGQMLVPIPTGALLKLIERDAADLDLYANLIAEGEGVEGVTYFYPSARPKVKILRALTEQTHRRIVCAIPWLTNMRMYGSILSYGAMPGCRRRGRAGVRMLCLRRWWTGSNGRRAIARRRY